MSTYSPEWLAGLITGEGCFSLSTNKLKQSKTGWLRISPVFSITMTDLRVMDRVADSFRAYDLPVYVQDITAENTRRERRPATRIHVNGIKRLHRISTFFIPYLDGNKLDAACAVRDFCEHRLTRHHRGITDLDIDCVERVRNANATNGVKNHSVSDLRDYKVGLEQSRKI